MATASPASPSASMTESLRSTLQYRRKLWQTWAKEQQQLCLNTIQQHQPALQQQQVDIDETAQSLLALQLERQCHVNNENNKNDKENDEDEPLYNNSNNKNNRSQEDGDNAIADKELEQKQEELKQLQEKLDHRKERLQVLQVQETHEAKRKATAHKILVDVQTSAQTTLAVLQKATLPYEQYTGLSFERPPHSNQIRLVWTHLDINDLDRRFSVGLALDEDNQDAYVVMIQDENDDNNDDEEEHGKNSQDCGHLVQETWLNALNQTDNMGTFARTMRRAILDHVVVGVKKKAVDEKKERSPSTSNNLKKRSYNDREEQEGQTTTTDPTPLETPPR